MWDILVPWCIGVLVTIPAAGLLIWLAAPLRSLDVEDTFFFLSELMERTLESITTSVTFSLPVVAAVGITYGFYRLGLLVMAWAGSLTL